MTIYSVLLLLFPKAFRDEYGGEMLYINKSLTRPLWAMEFSRDEGLRKYVDDFTPPFHKDSPDYNRNQDSHAIEDVRRWYDYWRERPGTGDRVNAGGVNIIFSDSNTHFRGEENYRRSGEVDAMRIPKDGYFANQVMWDGWVDVARSRALWDSVFQAPKSLAARRLWVDEPSAGIPFLYVRTGAELSGILRMQNDSRNADRVLGDVRGIIRGVGLDRYWPGLSSAVSAPEPSRGPTALGDSAKGIPLDAKPAPMRGAEPPPSRGKPSGGAKPK